MNSNIDKLINRIHVNPLLLFPSDALDDFYFTSHVIVVKAIATPIPRPPELGVCS